MGLRKAVALCLTFVVVVNAEGSIFGDLAARENQLNCLLGKPNCIPPSPPPPGFSLAGTPGAAGTNPADEETSGSSPESPGSSPEGDEPGISGFSPFTAPTAGPALGNAVARVTLSFPDGYIVTAQVRQQLTDIIQQALGTNAQVQLQIGTGRKLLEDATLTLIITDATDCGLIARLLDNLFKSGQFVQRARSLNIPLLAASLSGFACTRPGEAPVVISDTPTGAPGSSPTGETGTSGGGGSTGEGGGSITPVIPVPPLPAVPNSGVPVVPNSGPPSEGE